LLDLGDGSHDGDERERPPFAPVVAIPQIQTIR
jgi:hypothetical protein